MIITRRECGSECGHEHYTNAHAALACSREFCYNKGQARRLSVWRGRRLLLFCIYIDRLVCERLVSLKSRCVRYRQDTLRAPFIIVSTPN